MTVEQASVRFGGQDPPVCVKIQIDLEILDLRATPMCFRGRVLELGGMRVLSDLRIAPGKHVLGLGQDRQQYNFELLQQGSDWFRATLITSSAIAWRTKIRRLFRLPKMV